MWSDKYILMNFVTLLWLFQVVWGRNLDLYHEPSVITFKPPQPLRNDSFFGFSTTYDQFNKRIMISAPRETDIGEVYECGLTKVTDYKCSKLVKNITREVPLYTHDYWFGASIIAGPDFVMACTPRYARQPENCTKPGTYGRCYIRQRNDSHFNITKHPSQEGGIVKGNYTCTQLEKSMDSLGWSMDIGQDQKSIIVGGPSMYHTTGIAAIEVLELPAIENTQLMRIANRQKSIYNFGYSVTTGYFTDEEKLGFAVSTTYGTDGSGQVYFYSSYNSTYVTLKKGIDIQLVGSMFGAALCAAKLNILPGKGNDLLVGAPTYGDKSTYSAGAVYVYEFSRNGFSFRRKIVSEKSGSLFGTAIISVGDLNGDSQDEIAIGAPFEDNHGAVYLYSGAVLLSNSDRELTCLQKIIAADTNIMSFGYKLSALSDYDENGCNELAISAPYSDRVMLYKCLAAITITGWEVTFPEVRNRTATGTTDFEFKLCMNVKYPEKLNDVIAELSTNISMNHQNGLIAVLKKPNMGNIYNFKTKLQRKVDIYCKDVAFVLPVDKDYSSQIEYLITTELRNNPFGLNNVNGSHVVLSDKSHLSHSGALSAAECEGYHGCVSNLSLTVSSDIGDKPLITGSRDKVVYQIKVLNSGEVAYDPCVQFTIIGGIVAKPPMYCDKNLTLDETWICRSMKPVRTSFPWEIKNLDVDLSGLTNLDKEVLLDLKIFEHCSNKTKSQSFHHRIKLESSSAGVRITKHTDIGDTTGMVEKDFLSSKHFEQIYAITNKGPTNFKGITSIVKLQKTDIITYSEVPVSISTTTTLQSEGIREMCNVTSNSEFEITATCHIERLFKDLTVRVAVAIDTNPDILTYEKLKILKLVDFKSLLMISFEEKFTEKNSLNKTLTTSIYLRTDFVEPWMLIAAVVVGLLLLLILAVVLYKSGFLRRKNKRKLERLKKDIKRQTIRRSMLDQHQAADLRKMLEDVQEADEADEFSSRLSINLDERKKQNVPKFKEKAI